MRLGLALSLLVWSMGSVKAQERPEATLDYQAPASCPTEQGFRDVVAARMGYDPFIESAGQSVVVELETAGGGYVGGMVLREDDAVVGERTFDMPQASCAELASSIAVAVSIALDPFGDATAAPVPTERAEPQETSNPPADPPPDPQPMDMNNVDRSMRFAASLDFTPSLGLTPAIAMGAAVRLAIQWPHFSLGIDGRFDVMPGHAESGAGDRIRASLYTAGPSVCAHFQIGLICAGAEFGAFQGRAPDVSDPQTQSAFFSSVDIEGGVQLPLTSRLSMRALLELRIPLIRNALAIDGMQVWDPPPVGAALRIGLGMTI